MKMIDKDAVVAELEDWRDKIKKGIFSIPLTGSDRAYATFEYEILGKIKDFLDTLEVKEVDFEKECSQYFEGWTVQDDLGLTKPDGWSCIVKDLYDIAKHFFELGLKARK